MKESECVLFAKVLCVAKGNHYYGRVGMIGQIDRINGKLFMFYVEDSEGQPIGCGWSMLTSWDVVVPAPLGDKKIKVLSRECPCGIARIDCDYHNGKN